MKMRDMPFESNDTGYLQNTIQQHVTKNREEEKQIPS